MGVSLTFQWLGICLPMQGTHVRYLVQEDPTCQVATKPASSSYWSLCTQSPCSPTRKATAMRSPRTTARIAPALYIKKVQAQQWRLSAAINKLINLKKKYVCTILEAWEDGRGKEEGKTFFTSPSAHGRLQRATLGSQNHLVNKDFRTFTSRF